MLYPTGLNENDIEELVKDRILSALYDYFVYFPMKKEWSIEGRRKAYFLIKWVRETYYGDLS